MSLIFSPVDANRVIEIYQSNESYVYAGDKLLRLDDLDICSPENGKVFYRVDRNEPSIKLGDLLAMIGYERRTGITPKLSKSKKT